MGKHILDGVLCEVNNCVYWEKGNRCSANEILVVSQQGHKASSVEETDCQTFKRE
ncbi:MULTISPECIES: DUF1540 domain-containing protein [Bacillaceae]|uniref:DUF1540 domain-containing protein n=1 Tax=Pseudobacillus wudalianchiensis TaxID=1743143 RepID=A0A1B9B6P6_9BACI|nr:DUF1540 domain-containing protein [Bacillus wudalianchiensis]